MDDLIKALEIFRKYIPREPFPTHCEHDVLYVVCAPGEVSETDIAILEGFQFRPDWNEDCFYSYWYGSA